MLSTAILLGIWAAIAGTDYRIGCFGFETALMSGLVVGIILGDPATGVLIGGTLELMWMGQVAVGGSILPDIPIGATLATAFGILGGRSVEGALAIGLPVGLAAAGFRVLHHTTYTVLARWADREAERANFRGIEAANLTGTLFHAVQNFVVVFAAVYFGAEHVAGILKAMPEWLSGGLATAGQMLPAVGIGILLKLMWDNRLLPFLALGYVGFAYLKMNLVALGIAGAALGVLYVLVTQRKEEGDLGV